MYPRILVNDVILYRYKLNEMEIKMKMKWNEKNITNCMLIIYSLLVYGYGWM